jgi:ribosomal protein S11
MESWHQCDTTHCRAGWVVHLAGKEGYELERKTSTPFAAMQIYDKSSSIKVSPVRFYEDNKKAMADIQKCAEEEKTITKP